MCTTELCLPNNAATTTSQDSMSSGVIRVGYYGFATENEHNISDLENDLILIVINYHILQIKNHGSSNEGSIAVGSGIQSNQTPTTDCQEVASWSQYNLTIRQ